MTPTDAERYQWLRSDAQDAIYDPFWEKFAKVREDEMDALIDKWMAVEFCEHDEDLTTCGECNGALGVGA